MAAFFQLLRDRIFGRAFIILPRQPEENPEEQKSPSDAAEISSTGDDDDEKRADKSSISISNNNDQNFMKTSDDMKIKIEKLKASSSLNASHIDLTNLYSDMKHTNDLEKRCKSVLNLALWLIEDSPDIEFSDLVEAVSDLNDSHNFPVLAVCHALLLYAFTRMSMSLAELEILEDIILNLISSLKRKDIGKSTKMYKTAILVKDHNEIAFKLCQQLFKENYLDLWNIDISTICCSTLYNFSLLIKQHDDELGAKYCFKSSTIKYILGMTGKSTQEIVSEFMITQKQSCPSISSHRVNQCLHVLEHAMSVNPSLSNCESLHHENFSLPHCLTRLLGWSVSSVFPDEAKSGFLVDSDFYKFHLSTLVCLLKVLSVMTFNPHQYDSFTNVKGLMEKILICALKAYFESERSHFDIQILCLEMLINLYIKNQKTFVLLCLKKFRINESEEVLAVEALLKMLSDNLEKIKEVKQSTPYPQNTEKSEVHSTISNNNVEQDIANEGSNKKPRKENLEETSKESDKKNPENRNNRDISNVDAVKKLESVESDPILLAASKDMELSTIVSFICVLIVFFMRTKQSFKEFILSKLTSQALKEATDVSRKFLDFASLTGGMPVTGILILTETINKLQTMQTA